MESLIQKLGRPPYRLDQVLPLLDEASSLPLNTEETSPKFHDNAVRVIELMESLAELFQFSLHEVIPQPPDPAVLKRIVPGPNNRTVLESIGPEVLQLKSWLFEHFQKLPEISNSELGHARLCQYCNWAFQRIARGPYNAGNVWEGWHLDEITRYYLLANDSCTDFSVLEERSKKGCEFCLLIHQRLREIVQHPELDDLGSQRVFVWIKFRWERRDTRFLCGVEVSLDACYRELDKSLLFSVETTHNHVAKDLGIFRPPATTSLDPTNLDFIKRQLGSTEKDIALNWYLPKRLVDIGLGTQIAPKLIDGQQAVVDDSGLRYAALSYCWGSAEQSMQQLKLNSETGEMFYSSIPLALMTPVLRDAIAVCQVLGLRYLWIDSLCIQQGGSSTDWEEQSREMSHIFANSWLTICATASSSCLEGFLDHPDRQAPTIEIDYVAKESLQVQGSFWLRLLTLNGRPGFGKCDFSGPRLAPLLRDLSHSKWNERGWVFQERLLSSRLLYFGARMIHFQHGDHVRSENGFYEDFFIDPRRIPTPGAQYCSTNMTRQLETIRNQGPLITDFWYKVITIYSLASLTNRRDTLPAIAGMARRVHEFTSHRYLAGMWEEDLCCGLLWMPLDIGANSESESRRPPASLQQLLRTFEPASSIAPSWSWASRNSRVGFSIKPGSGFTCRRRRHLRAEFEGLQTHVLVDGVNNYGRISSASLSLLGTMIKMTPACMRDLSHSHEPCEPLPGLFAFVRVDWFPLCTFFGRATGIKKHMLEHFRLLQIASCCSDCIKIKHAGNEDMCAKKLAPIPLHRPHTDEQSDTNESPEQRHSRMRFENLLSYEEDSFYKDGHPEFDASVHCGLCSDETIRRDVWGLLLYPAEAPGTFYRVGKFNSRALHGGTALFVGAERSRIVLV